MDGPFLAIDLGNRRLKAGLFAAPGRLAAELTLDYEELASGWAPWVALQPPVQGAALSSVLGAARLPGHLALIQAALPTPLVTNPTCGLRLDVRSPETVGCDRLYAARGAIERGHRQAIVVDVGTALTVDAVRAWSGAEGAAAPVAERGVFLGGAIAPGPELVARALGAAAQLYEVRPSPTVPALGKDTRSALEAGVAHTVAGAALRLAERVRAESGLDAAQLVLTGGARAFVRAALAEAGWTVSEVPQLVLEGLVACVRPGWCVAPSPESPR